MSFSPDHSSSCSVSCLASARFAFPLRALIRSEKFYSFVLIHYSPIYHDNLAKPYKYENNYFKLKIRIDTKCMCGCVVLRSS